jgi:hypothetical protein
VHVPLKSMLASKEAFDLCTTEIFGPFQVHTLQHPFACFGVLTFPTTLSHHKHPPTIAHTRCLHLFALLNTMRMRARTKVITTYGDDEVDSVLEACERMAHHLTAAVVSNDVLFQNRVLGATVNGTTYVGRRARTTGAPQNHWFGPAGDPRGAGIGSPEAIKLVWSSHREVILDEGPISASWATPPPS